MGEITLDIPRNRNGENAYVNLKLCMMAGYKETVNIL